MNSSTTIEKSLKMSRRPGDETGNDRYIALTVKNHLFLLSDEIQFDSQHGTKGRAQLSGTEISDRSKVIIFHF